MKSRRWTVAGLVTVAVLVIALATTLRPSLAAFPGANGKIIFTSDRDGNDEIYVMNTDGSGQTNLTNNPATDSRPAWSPDGLKIVFTSSRDDNSEIYVMNADGSGQTRLTTNPATDISPDAP
jgi:Tol biopolymer transport system component